MRYNSAARARVERFPIGPVAPAQLCGCFGGNRPKCLPCWLMQGSTGRGRRDGNVKVCCFVDLHPSSASSPGALVMSKKIVCRSSVSRPACTSLAHYALLLIILQSPTYRYLSSGENAMPWGGQNFLSPAAGVFFFFFFFFFFPGLSLRKTPPLNGKVLAWSR